MTAYDQDASPTWYCALAGVARGRRSPWPLQSCQLGLAWTLGVRAREGALGSISSPNNSLLGLFVLAGVDQCVAIEDPSTDGRAACPFLRGVQVHSGAILSQASLNVDPVPREVLSSS